ncbi:MAG: hypothetical protein C4583_07275 [Anaerolineaceae bacterium]|nr:MAG: hypothetical protein C4583_07275 [Anaerolineaceae bacterium]
METQQPQTPQQPAYDAAKMEEMQRLTFVMNLQRAMKSGASNFYWIAGLSVVNSLVNIFGWGVFFVMGLGVTLFIDVVAGGISQNVGGSPLILVMGLLFSLVFDAIFIAFGYFAGKGHRWAFIVGMALYSLDAALLLFLQDWLAFGFHLFLLYGIWQGFSALGKLKALEAANLMAVPPADMMR